MYITILHNSPLWLYTTQRYFMAIYIAMLYKGPVWLCTYPCYTMVLYGYAHSHITQGSCMAMYIAILHSAQGSCMAMPSVLLSCVNKCWWRRNWFYVYDIINLTADWSCRVSPGLHIANKLILFVRLWCLHCPGAFFTAMSGNTIEYRLKEICTMA